MTELSITVVLEHYGAIVAVPDTGWRKIKCPFHDDRTASASVNLELNAFRCHGCGVSGDAIKLIELREHTDYRGAIEFASTILGESVEALPRYSGKSRKPRRATWRRGLFD